MSPDEMHQVPGWTSQATRPKTGLLRASGQFSQVTKGSVCTPTPFHPPPPPPPQVNWNLFQFTLGPWLLWRPNHSHRLGAGQKKKGGGL